MANNPLLSPSAAANKRVLRSLITYIERKEFDRTNWPHTDPVLKKKTVEAIHQAFDAIEASKSSGTPIQKYYEKLLGEDPVYCTTPGQQMHPDKWEPLESIRWNPIRCEHVVSGSTMLLFTPVDVFSVMSCKVELARTTRVFYGIQSLLAKENARYYLSYTANPRARRPSWSLRALGSHDIAKGLPIILGTTACFSSRNRRALEELNPLPPLQPIPPEQSALHDFIVQIITSDSISRKVDYKGRKFTEGIPTKIRRDTRAPATSGNNLSKALINKVIADAPGSAHPHPSDDLPIYHETAN